MSRMLILLSILYLIASAAGVQVCAGSDYYYTYFKERRSLELDTTRIAFFIGEPLDSALRSDAAPCGLNPLPVEGWWLAEVPGDVPTEEEVLTFLGQVEPHTYVSPVFGSRTDDFSIILPEILVRFRPEVTAAAAEVLIETMEAGSVTDRDLYGLKGLFCIQSPAGNGLEVLGKANRLAELPEVLYAEPSRLSTAHKAYKPNDPKFKKCWGLHNTGASWGEPDADMDGPEAFEITRGKGSVIVVVFDDGVQQDHPDIKQRKGKDFTSQAPGNGGPVNKYDNHGTLVAGCISGMIDNGIGGCGIAPECKVASARIMISKKDDFHATIKAKWIMAGLEWAKSIGARVTNCSFWMTDESSALDDMFMEMKYDGMIHFASAGNKGEGDPEMFKIVYPAKIPAVNAVAALNRAGKLATFSKYGSGLAFSAPGEEIFTTDRTGSKGYNKSSGKKGDYFHDALGTSFASPYAAGVAALVFSVKGSLMGWEVEEIMQETCDDLGPAGYDTYFGHGFVNARRAVTRVQVKQKSLTVNPEPSDGFGGSAALWGDWAAVGSRNNAVAANTGAVHTYFRDGNTWKTAQVLMAQDQDKGDHFGDTVALKGQWLLAGAQCWDAPNKSDCGAAYIFKNVQGVWHEKAVLLASNAKASAKFGAAVALYGKDAVVGAPRFGWSKPSAGRAYVFVRTDGAAEWTEQAILKPEYPKEGDWFGCSVDLFEDFAVVGARYNDHCGEDAGAVYTFMRSGGIWKEQSFLAPSSLDGGDRFGEAVAIDGYTLAVGAPYRDKGGSNRGAVYIFERESAGYAWKQTAELTPNEGGAGAHFGCSVALSNNKLAVGAWKDGEGDLSSGAVYLFKREGSKWIQKAKVTPDKAEGLMNYGETLSLSGEEVLVGAPGDDKKAVDGGGAFILKNLPY